VDRREGREGICRTNVKVLPTPLEEVLCLQLSVCLQVTELIPWGDEGIIELEFRDGRYCIKACDGRYLDREGALVSHPTVDTMFTVEMRSDASPDVN